MSSDEEPEDDEPLDPRIQAELEKLNKAALLINQLEVAVDDARATWRQLLSESTQNLDALSKKLGSCIEKAKPYYEAHSKAVEAQVLVQRAAARFERAISMQAAAREMVELAEQSHATNGRKQPTSMDSAALEVLNHATIKVMQAESDKLDCEIEHKNLSSVFLEEQEIANALAKDLKKHVTKSKPYYDAVHHVHKCLDEQKAVVEKLERDVVAAKAMYNKALQRLEAISNDIHLRRQQASVASNLGQRSQGVGSETPLPPTALADLAPAVLSGGVSKPSGELAGTASMAAAHESAERALGAAATEDDVCVGKAAAGSLPDSGRFDGSSSSNSDGGSAEQRGADGSASTASQEAGEAARPHGHASASEGRDQSIAEDLLQPAAAAVPRDGVDGAPVSPSHVDVVVFGGEGASAGSPVAPSDGRSDAAWAVLPEACAATHGVQAADVTPASTADDHESSSGTQHPSTSSVAPHEPSTWKRAARRLSDGELREVALSAQHGLFFGLSLDSATEPDSGVSTLIDKAPHQHTTTFDRKSSTLFKRTSYDRLPPPLAHLQQHYNHQQRASFSDPEVSADLSRILASLLSDQAASLV